MNRRVLLQRSGYLGVVLLFIAIPLFIKNNYYLHTLCMIGIFIMLSLGFRLLTLVGQITVGHGAFMAIGAYASAMLTARWDVSFWIALPVAAAVTAIIALPLGYVSLRLKGVYFIMVSFAFALMLVVFLKNTPESWLGGARGYTNIPFPQLWGIDFYEKMPYYYLVLALVLVTVFIMYRLEKSSIGKIFQSIKQADVLARCVGINIMNYKVLALVIACFFAGIAGSLWAHIVGAVSPTSFNLYVSIYVMAYAVIGGLGSIAGPIVGTLVVIVVAEFARSFGNYEIIFYGVALLLVMLFMPEGIVGLWSKLSRGLKRLGKMHTRERRVA